MADMVQIRSWKQLYNDYIYEGFNKGATPEEIKRNLVEAFRKEIFGQMMFRFRVADPEDIPQTEKNEKILTNIFEQAQKKWRAIIAECNKHMVTLHMLKEDDLTLFDKPEPEEAEEDEEPEEEEVDEATAEWPELAEDDGDEDFTESDIYPEEPVAEEPPKKTGMSLA